METLPESVRKHVFGFVSNLSLNAHKRKMARVFHQLRMRRVTLMIHAIGIAREYPHTLECYYSSHRNNNCSWWLLPRKTNLVLFKRRTVLWWGAFEPLGSWRLFRLETNGQ